MVSVIMVVSVVVVVMVVSAMVVILMVQVDVVARNQVEVVVMEARAVVQMAVS